MTISIKALTVASMMKKMTMNSFSSNLKSKLFYLSNKTKFFLSRAEEDQDDVVDSDFSIDENDEPISDHEDEGTKRKRGVVSTKAYKVCLFY
jgi:hypothetical protein